MFVWRATVSVWSGFMFFVLSFQHFQLFPAFKFSYNSSAVVKLTLWLCVVGVKPHFQKILFCGLGSHNRKFKCLWQLLSQALICLDCHDYYGISWYNIVFYCLTSNLFHFQFLCGVCEFARFPSLCIRMVNIISRCMTTLILKVKRKIKCYVQNKSKKINSKALLSLVLLLLCS